MLRIVKRNLREICQYEGARYILCYVAGKKVFVDVAKAGRLGGKARAERLSQQELSDAGRRAVETRWEAYYKAHPEKLKAKLEKQKRKTPKA